MSDERSGAPEHRAQSIVGGLRTVQRRSFLRGVAGGVAGAVAAGLVAPGGARAATQDQYNLEETRDGKRTVPFYGHHQAGIATPPQTAAAFLAFDVTAASRDELTRLFHTLTARAAFLTAGGTPPSVPPNSAPSDDRLLGPTVLPDDLTVTVALGASLFDGRFGLGPRKPAQLQTMRAFAHDHLDRAISDGDLLLQLCAGHRDTVGHALLDILRHTAGALRPRWRIDGFRFPPRPVGIPRDWMGFKDGITNPDTANASQMNQQVWVPPGAPEPAWTAGGTYQVVRIIRMFLDKWNTVPVEQQEQIFGRRKVSGAPLYATSPDAPDNLDPIYTNDPQGLLTPLNCHIRRANPQTPQTAATSAILRRSFQYDRSPDVEGNPDMGHVFCCFQQQLTSYVAMQTRLEDEMLVPFISPVGGGYFFALPGVSDAEDYYGRALLS
ncbi:MAG TPA: Dyp-type peroxidase [Acidimicrobiia bacterium]|nr:Dyp-type peroxidase [Acidimicrobiia bacterium]